ncbi:MAG: anti-sigma factor [Vicinamibacterales bacterium]
MIPAQDDNLFQEAPGFEQRLSDLQAQIDRLTIALQLWRDGQERIARPDERLARFADDVADVLQEWSAIGERHARAVDALEHQVAAFASAEARLHDESAQRFLTLQRMVQQEWAALRTLQLEPSGHGREQAAALTHACIVATTTRVLPDPADAANNAAEAELQQYFSQVVTDAPAPAVVEPVTAPVDASPADAAALVSDPDPAEPVVLHVEPAPTVAVTVPEPAFDASLLEQTPEQAPLAPPEPIEASAHAAVSRPQIAREYVEHDESDALRAEMMRRMAEMRVVFRESLEQATDLHDMQNRTTWRVLMVVATAFVLLAAGGTWWAVGQQRNLAATQSRLDAVEASSARAQAATERALADAQAQAARLADAAKQAEADTAAMSAVLASPDLVRYGLAGANGSSIAAQLLWSRARGLVLSATDVPPLEQGQAYQVWLLTDSDAVSAGLLRVAPGGRGSLIAARPPAVTGPVVGVSITREPGAGSVSPSGPIVALNRIVRTAP